MRYTMVFFALILMPMLYGCGKSEPAVIAQAPETADAAAAESPSTKQAGDDRKSPQVDQRLMPDAAYPIPDLSASQLLNYINQLATLEPRGETDDEYVADQVSRAKSRLLASDQIILTKGIPADLLEAGVRAKFDALRMLAILDPQGLGKNFQLFVDALNKGDSEKFFQMGRISEFWLEVDRLVYERTENADSLLKKLKALLDEASAGEAEFLAAQDAAIVMNDRGFADECTQALKMIGNRFADDKELGKEATELLAKTEFREKVIAAMGGGRSEVKSLFEAIRDLLQDKDNLTVETLDNTLNAAQVLEYNGRFREARSVFAAIRKAFRNAADEKLAEQAEISVQFAEKRLNIVGKEIELEGNYVDGTDFNWATYKGKVVLVDFWASTSAPWLASLPDLRTAYDRFHQDGFEVLGINVDHDRQRAYQYLQRERLPWSTIVDEISSGLDANPNAIRYGIRAVPFVMLVGRDGKVTDIHLRGTQLTKRIEALLSEPTTQNARNENSVRK